MNKNLVGCRNTNKNLTNMNNETERKPFGKCDIRHTTFEISIVPDGHFHHPTRQAPAVEAHGIHRVAGEALRIERVLRARCLAVLRLAKFLLSVVGHSILYMVVEAQQPNSTNKVLVGQ